MTTDGAYHLSRCAAGTELFRSDKAFKLFCQLPGKGQTLLRSVGSDPEGPLPQMCTDLLFVHTTFLRVHDRYDGLIVRMPTAAEAENIRAGMPAIEDFYNDRGHPEYMQPVILESGGKLDFLVADVFRWCKAPGTFFEPSPLAEPCEPDGPPWVRMPLVGLDGGLGAAATLADLREALDHPETPKCRPQYRYVYVLMFKATLGGKEHVTPRAVFLTRREAESEVARQLSDYAGHEWWVESVPIAV